MNDDFSSETQTKNFCMTIQKQIKIKATKRVTRLKSAQIGSGWIQTNQMTITGEAQIKQKMIRK